MFISFSPFPLRFEPLVILNRSFHTGATPKVPSFVLRVGPTGQAAALLAWTTTAASRSELAPGTVQAAPDWPGSSAGCFLAPVESFSQSVL